ncbi:MULTISPECIES: hypothetical protein [Nocardia]|uniref:Uncharacterized protein n=1 Tax=Nocardia elegans TaxID=300029 RepID=A0ABW6T831_9NOCA|nr:MULTISPECIES: hypothetical protein [Nocardia]MBF6243645.1 hypothetical protein [Nocardia elegans]MBF6448981.1 hypothetical protein [Nocardia elegans]
MTTREAQQSGRWSVVWGLCGGVAVAVIYVPITIALQHALNVPEPTAVPRHLRAPHTGAVSPAYSALLLLAPAAVFAMFGRTRRIAAGYALIATLIGGVLAAAVISMDVGGFAPN